MVKPALLGMMHERLQQAMDNDLPFGGMEVIALGDFINFSHAVLLHCSALLWT
jgi:hypothetical protein